MLGNAVVAGGIGADEIALDAVVGRGPLDGDADSDVAREVDRGPIDDQTPDDDSC